MSGGYGLCSFWQRACRSRQPHQKSRSGVRSAFDDSDFARRQPVQTVNDLIDELIRLAMERYTEKKRNRYSKG